MKIGSVLFLCLASLSIVSCNKHDENYYVQDSFKDWTLFKNGSYWIYLDEKSNTIDSVWVMDFPEEYFYAPDDGGKHYEIIRYTVADLAEFILSGGIDESYLRIEGAAGRDIINSSSVTANITDHVSSRCGVINRYDTLQINHIKFPHVIHIRDSSNNSVFFKVADYYFARNIGIIKYSVTNDSITISKSLLRWHVNQ